MITPLLPPAPVTSGDVIAQADRDLCPIQRETVAMIRNALPGRRGGIASDSPTLRPSPLPRLSWWLRARLWLVRLERTFAELRGAR